jgi:hypothetical protein
VGRGGGAPLTTHHIPPACAPARAVPQRHRRCCPVPGHPQQPPPPCLAQRAVQALGQAPGVVQVRGPGTAQGLPRAMEPLLLAKRREQREGAGRHPPHSSPGPEEVYCNPQGLAAGVGVQVLSLVVLLRARLLGAGAACP